jgi:hypothetical protein
MMACAAPGAMLACPIVTGYVVANDGSPMPIVGESGSGSAYGPQSGSGDAPKRGPAILLFEQNPSLIAHETNTFTIDIMSMPVLWGVPPWLQEGFADHMAGVWTTEGEQVARDAVGRGLLPSQLTQLSGPPREQFHLGHAVVDFIDREFGQAGIRRFLSALRSGSQANGPTPYQMAFGITPDEFDREFQQFMLEGFRRDIAKRT